MGKLMNDVFETIEYKGVEYRLVFNLNVIEILQDKYGTVQNWIDTINAIENEGDAKAVKFGFEAMLNEGIDMMNEDNGTDIKPLTPKAVGRMITEIGMANAVEKLNETVVESTKSNEKNS